MPSSPIEVIDLKVVRFNVAAVLDRELGLRAGPGALEFITRELPEQMAQQLIAQLKVPAQVVQENRLLHRHPATLWDHIKQRLRAHVQWLKPWLPVAYTEIRLTEHLLYPTVKVPEEFADTVRLYVAPSFDLGIE